MRSKGADCGGEAQETTEVVKKVVDKLSRKKKASFLERSRYPEGHMSTGSAEDQREKKSPRERRDSLEVIRNQWG